MSRASDRPSARRVLGLGALWLSVSAASLLAPGCYGRNCEGGVEVFGVEPGQGRMVDPDTWESTDIGEPWLWFPRQRYYVFDLRALGGRTPKPLAYVSPSPEPTKNGGNFTIGSGNIVEFFNVSPNRIDVKNDTCSDYYLYLELKVPPLPPEAHADAGANDAIDPADAPDGGDADGGDAF